MCSLAFFVYEYASNDEVRLNNMTIVILNVQLIIFSLLVLFKIVIDENSNTKLVRHLFFWIFSAIVLRAVIFSIHDGLHPYLVANYIEIYKAPWMELFINAFGLLYDLFLLIGICLIGRESSDRLCFRSLSFSRNKAPHR